jgi:hypothetical protein
VTRLGLPTSLKSPLEMHEVNMRAIKGMAGKKLGLRRNRRAKETESSRRKIRLQLAIYFCLPIRKTGNKSQPSPGDRLCKSELHLGPQAKHQCAGGMSIPRLSPRRYWEGRLDGVCLYRDIASIHRNPR